MKKIGITLLAAAAVCAACTREEIPTSNEVVNPADDDAGDDISQVSFDRLVTVTFSAAGATVSGHESSDSLSVIQDGNHVTVTDIGKAEIIEYELSGTAADGSFTLYSQRKQAIRLSGVSLTNPAGAAINNQSGKRTFIVLEGENALTDGSDAAYAVPETEDCKAVFFSEGQLVISGTGALSVKALNKLGKSAIASDDYVHVMEEPTIRVTAGSGAGHGIRGKDYVRISGGDIDISTAAAMKKGISSEGCVLVEGGSTAITVTGGTAYDSEDKEYKGSAGIRADNYFGMTGGTLTITNSGAGGKGISAGSYDFDAKTHQVADSYISGGTLRISTTGSETNDVSAKGIKIGWVTKSGTGDRAKVTAYAGNLLISGGDIVVSAAKSEGVEAKGNLTISGGSLWVSSTGDDAINAQAELNVTDGYVYAYSSANDAMDSNHDTNISGGYVFAISTRGTPEVAIDANTEDRYKLNITGGVVVAYGGLESGYSSSNTVRTLAGTAGAWNALWNGSSFIAAFKAPADLSSFAVCAPSLSGGYKDVHVGEAIFCNGVWATSGISDGTAVDLTDYTGGGNGPGGDGPGGDSPGGGGWPGGGGPGGGRPW